MAAIGSAIVSFFGGSAGAATAATAAAGIEVGFGLEGLGAAAAGGTIGGAEALGTAAAAAGVGAGVGSSLLKDAGGTLLKAGAQGVAGAVASSLLQPKLPGLPKPVRMPDPLEQQEAQKKSIIEQTARRGRAASILTEPAGSDRLGG